MGMVGTILEVDAGEKGPVGWDKENKTLSAMASDMGLRAGQWPACILIKGRTGSASFGNPIPVTDREGDLQCMEYFPAINSMAAGKVRKFIVFND